MSGINTVLQDQFLEEFFSSQLAGSFNLTGGTARFGEIEIKGKTRLDSLENIAVNKVLAVFGRTDAKDFIDLYFLLKDKGFVLEDLIEKAKEKDLGLSEFYLANSVAAVENVTQWPQMLVPLDKNELVRFYQDISRKLLLEIKPKK